jgi:predicted nucleic acid-binding protein
LALAVAGHADIIVTGDNDMLSLDPFQGIRIMGPAEFLRSFK